MRSRCRKKTENARQFSRAFFLVWVLVLPVTVSADAESVPNPNNAGEIIQQASAIGLHADPVWKRLLHWPQVPRESSQSAENGAESSDVVTKAFFLDKGGNTDPRAELIATIHAGFLPFDAATANQHAVCQFPARFFWLQHKLKREVAEWQIERCQHLQRWAKFDSLESVSLLFVGSFLGNPASSFGHLLLQLDNAESPNARGLLNTAINFGAITPENENPFVYVTKGLFGGYNAGFTNKEFYVQDQVYAGDQYRDIWRYRLNLNDYQRRLMVLHLWELVGDQFVYFFLKENCAYRLAELLQLVLDEDLITDTRIWYSPIEVVHAVASLSVDSGEPLIADYRLLPSPQRIFYEQFKALEPQLRHLVYTAIENPNRVAASSFFADTVTTDQQRQVLDVLLGYYEYRLGGDRYDELEALREAKRKVLLKRLRLPAAAPDQPEIAGIAPHRFPAPSKLSLSGWYNNANDSAGASVGYTAYGQDLLSVVDPADGEMVVFDLSARLDEEGRLALEQFTGIRVTRVNVDSIDLPGENPWSWQLSLGAQRRDLSCQHCIDAYFQGGFGRAKRLGQHSAVMGLANLLVDSGKAAVSALPELSFVWNCTQRMSWLATVGYEQPLSDARRADWHASLAGRKYFGRDKGIQFKAAHERDYEVTLGWIHHF